MRTMNRILLLAGWVLGVASALLAQDPFGAVAPTGKSYTVVVSSATINASAIPTGSWIGVFDGSRAVGSAQYQGTWPLAVTAWQGDAGQGLDGFTTGNPITFRIRSTLFDTTMTLATQSSFSQGDGRFGTGAFAAVELSATNTRVPNLVREEDGDLEFGSVRMGVDKSLSIVLRNQGNARLTISSFGFSHQGFSTTLSPTSINPGGSITVPIRYRPTSALPAAGTLTIRSDDPSKPELSVRLTGQGLPTLAPQLVIEPGSASFGYVPTGSYSVMNLSFRNTGTDTLRISNLSPSTSEFVMGRTSFNVLPGESQSVIARFQPSAAGTRSANLLIQSNLPSGNVSYSLSGIGYASAFGTAVPTGQSYTVLLSEALVDELPLSAGDEVALYAGDVVVGQAIVTGTWPLAITAWKASSDPILPGFNSGDAIRIRTNPSRFGARALVWLDSLTWTQGDGTYSNGAFAAGRATGYSGRAPKMSVDRSTVDFGNVRTGSSSDLYRWVRNDGATSLQLSLQTSSPFSVIGGTSRTIQGGDSLLIGFRFAPTTATTHSGILRITTNDPFQGPADLPLAGRGLVTVSDTPVVFDMPSNPLLGLPLDRWTSVEIRLRNPFAVSASGRIEIRTAMQNMDVMDLPSSLVLEANSERLVRLRVRATSEANDTLRFVWLDESGGETVLKQFALAYRSLLPEVTSTGVSYTVIVRQLSTAGQALQLGDEIGVYDGQQIVGHGLYRGSTISVPITVWRADPSSGLPGFTPGNPIQFKIAKRARGYSDRQVLVPRTVTFDGTGRFGEGAFDAATISVNEPLFWFSRLRDENIIADSFTSKIWARLDTLVIDPDGGSIQYAVSTDNPGLAASIVNSRIVLSLQPGFVGPVRLSLRAQEGPYVLEDTVSITVVGRLTVQRMLDAQRAYPSIEMPVVLTGGNGLYAYPDPDALTVSVTAATGGFSHRRSGDTLYVKGVELGSHQVTLRVSEPGGQFHTQTVTWVVRSFDPAEGLTRYLPFNDSFAGAQILGGVSLDRDRFEYRRKAMRVDGVDGTDPGRGVTLANPVALDVTGDFTLSVWFETNGLKSTQTILNTMPHTVLGLSVNHFYRPGLTNLSLFAGDANGWRLDGPSVPTFTFNNQVWNHVVIVRSGSESWLYLNGSAVLQLNLEGLTGQFDLRLGSIGVASGESFDGSLDEFRVYSRAFAPWEVGYLYEQEALAPQNTTEFAGGNGTDTDPYRVATAAHLDNVRHFPSADFRQTQDIDLGQSPWNQNGGWLPIGDATLPFRGSYDGGHRSIRNLTIARPEASNQGLFGVIQNGAILTNLALNDATVDVGSVSGTLIGSANGAQIRNVHTSDLHLTSSGATIGGLIGRMTDSELSDSYSTGSLMGGSTVGGLVGETHSSTMSISISTSYSVVDVSGASDVGALIGISGTPTSQNAVRQTTDGPGLVGSGATSGIVGLTDAQMRDRQSFQNLGWNLQDTWDLFDTSYPFLKSLRPLQLPGKEYDWVITASAVVGSSQSGSVRFGMNSGATDGYDSNLETAITPPPPQDYISLYFSRPDWGAPLGPNFNADIRAPRELGMKTELWDLYLRTDFVGTGRLTIDYPDGFSGPMSVRYGDSLKIGTSDMQLDFVSDGTSILIFRIEVGDKTPPVIIPGIMMNGPRIFGSGVTRRLEWSATDENTLDRVLLAYRWSAAAAWIPILEQNTQFTDWTTPNVDGINDSLQFRILAYDRSGNMAEWMGSEPITVSSTTLEDKFPVGWSMRSVPLDSPTMTSSSQAYRFGWSNREYATLTSPVSGMGYWNGAIESGSAVFNGTVVEQPVSLQPLSGWNLMGSPLARAVAVDSIRVSIGTGSETDFDSAVRNGWIVGPLAFVQSSYQVASRLNPFEAYWVGSTRSDLVLHLPIHALMSSAPQKAPAQEGLLVDVTDSGITHRFAVRNEPAIPAPPSAPTLNRIGLRGDTGPLGSLYLAIKIDSTSQRSYPMVVEGPERELQLNWPNQSISGFQATLVVNGVARDMTSASSIRVRSTDEVALMVSPVSTSTERSEQGPLRTELMAAYPNPFNPSTQISYTLDAGRQTRLSVYDLLGRQVAVLVNGTMPAGRHQVTFDAAGLASGVYLVRLEAGGEVFTRRMTLLK